MLQIYCNHGLVALWTPTSAAKTRVRLWQQHINRRGRWWARVWKTLGCFWAYKTLITVYTKTVHRVEKRSTTDHRTKQNPTESTRPWAPLLVGLALVCLCRAFSRMPVKRSTSKGARLASRLVWMLQWVSSKKPNPHSSTGVLLATQTNNNPNNNGLKLESRRGKVPKVQSLIGSSWIKEPGRFLVFSVNLHFGGCKSNDAGLKCLCGFSRPNRMIWKEV